MSSMSNYDLVIFSRINMHLSLPFKKLTITYYFVYVQLSHYHVKFPSKYACHQVHQTIFYTIYKSM